MLAQAESYLSRYDSLFGRSEPRNDVTIQYMDEADYAPLAYLIRLKWASWWVSLGGSNH